MKTSGLFTVHGTTIPFTYAKPIILVFFGDVHRDSPNHANGKWQSFLSELRQRLKAGENLWFFGMGDYLDSTSTSDRECLGQLSAKAHETLKNDITALQLAKCHLFAKECEFMRGRIIGLLNGNHYFNFDHGANTDQKICELLSAAYLGVCSFVRLSFTVAGRTFTRDIFAHHGAGAARLFGGSFNRVQQMAEGAEADIYAMGHDHKRIASPGQPRLFLSSSNINGLKVEQREPVVVRSGSYLASYEPGVVNYNVDACRSPASLGHVEILIKISHTRGRDGRHQDAIEMRTLV